VYATRARAANRTTKFVPFTLFEIVQVEAQLDVAATTKTRTAKATVQKRPRCRFVCEISRALRFVPGGRVSQARFAQMMRVAKERTV
jgi:hypothetical protein